MWTVKPSKFFSDAEYYELVAIKADSRDGQAPLDGSSVTDSRISYDNGKGGSGKNNKQNSFDGDSEADFDGGDDTED